MVTVRLPFCSTSTLSIGRERENKLKKKCARKKREKKRLNCFRFLSGNMPPFPSFPHPGSPTPKAASAQPPPPSPFLWGGCRGDSHRERETREDRDQERHRGGGTNRQVDEPSDMWEHLSVVGVGEGGASAGRRALVGEHWGGSGGGERATQFPPPPHNPPAALLPEAGAQGEGVRCLQGPGRPQLGEHADHPPTFCAGLARVQLSSPQALTTQEKPTQREREAEQAEPLGLREPGGGDRGREGRSWGGGGRHRQHVGAQTRSHAPTLPRGQPVAQFVWPAPTPRPGGPGARSSLPAARWAGAPEGGRGTVRMCSAARQIQR